MRPNPHRTHAAASRDPRLARARRASPAHPSPVRVPSESPSGPRLRTIQVSIIRVQIRVTVLVANQTSKRRPPLPPPPPVGASRPALPIHSPPPPHCSPPPGARISATYATRACRSRGPLAAAAAARMHQRPRAGELWRRAGVKQEGRALEKGAASHAASRRRVARRSRIFARDPAD